MNEAIKLAIRKGGYRFAFSNKKESLDYSDYVGSPEETSYDEIVLDPLFWQALGKALGWDETNMLSYGLRYGKEVPESVGKALQYFEVALTGGDTEKFWKELLK